MCLQPKCTRISLCIPFFLLSPFCKPFTSFFWQPCLPSLLSFFFSQRLSLSVDPFFCPISAFIPQGVLSQSESNLPNYKPHLPPLPLRNTWFHYIHSSKHTYTHIVSVLYIYGRISTNTFTQAHKSHLPILLLFTVYFTA